jgi:aspartyl-tRNA(Asn)/glutamyl-tRNA(Gln) amidotransferase subunit B
MAGPWETVIGLETHVQLRTASKMFCGCSAAFGAPPNTNVCPVCLGLPGALPAPNGLALQLAARAAVALGCTVHRRSIFARKNYFYPDLPKGYQISQFEQPLATDGSLSYLSPDRGIATATIQRLHVEEDAGKSLHDRFPKQTAIDLNRCGVPLIEIVTGPDFRSPHEARAYLHTLKQVLEYTGISDCDMEKGSLRVDANVSVRRAGETTLGTKTEVKNINSFAYVEKALTVERDRQIALAAAEQGREPRLPLPSGPRPAAAPPHGGVRRGAADAPAGAPGDEARALRDPVCAQRDGRGRADGRPRRGRLL